LRKVPSFAAPEDNHAYLYWPRMIMFSLTGALSVAVTGLSSRGLKILNDQKNKVKAQIPGGALHATDILGSNGAVLATCGFAALSCVALSSIALFRLQRVETRRTVLIKELLFGFSVISELTAILAFTVITCTHSAVVVSTLLPQNIVNEVVAESGTSVAYIDSIAKSTMIVAWICWFSTSVTFVLVSLAARHILKHGSEPALGCRGQILVNGHANGHGNGHHASEKAFA